MITLSHATGPGADITLAAIEAVAVRDAPVALAPETAKLLADRRKAVERAVAAATETPIYGFNRGFGSNVREAVKETDLAQLQANLIRSHAAGVGPYAPRAVVRACVLLRARSLARGHSAVRPAIVEALIGMLNAGVTPAIPRYGSVSASGDLAPLSHVGLVVMGEGEALDPDEPSGTRAISTEEALAKARAAGRGGFAPVPLAMKEGLALNNGCQYSAAWLALATLQLERLAETAIVATAISAQVMFGSDGPFREDLHALRPHPGAQAAAAAISALMEASPMRALHREFDIDGEVQDPYNLRCAAQILGPCIDLVVRARATVAIEANSVTDNPIDLGAGGEADLSAIVSGGHFHGMPLAVEAYGLLQAAGIMARLSNMRCVRFVDPARNKGMGAQMKWPGLGVDGEPEALGLSPRATRSGLMLAEYVSAGLTNWIWGLAMPSHLFSLSTDSGQEDHVSMAANVAMRAFEAGERLAEALACELAMGLQAADVRKEMAQLHTRALTEAPGRPPPREAEALARALGSGPEAEAVKARPELGLGAVTESYEPVWRRGVDPARLVLSPPCEGALAAIREAFPTLTEDRVLSRDLAALARLALAGRIAAAAGGPRLFPAGRH